MPMFLFKSVDLLKKQINEKNFYHLFLAFCIFLPFQFALNPAPGFDVAIVRIIIPLIFLFLLLFNISINKREHFTTNSLARLILIFLFFATISVFLSQNISWSLRKLLFFFTLFPIYFIAISTLITQHRKNIAVFSLLIGGFLLSLVAIAQFASQLIFGIDSTYTFLASNITPFFLGNSFSNSVLAYPSWLVNAGGNTYMRAFAVFPDPHMLSYYLEMLIPWAIVMWALAKKHKWLFFAFMFFLIIADLLTFTRGSYLALIIGAFSVLPLVTKKTAGKILLGATMVGGLLLFEPQNPVVQRFTSSFDVQEGSNQGRLNNWQQALLVIQSHPFGVGIGAYSLEIKPSASYREPIYAHNTYLDLAAELGIHGALIFIAILLLAFKRFWILSKKQPFFIAGVASITIFAAHSMVENSLYSVHVLPLLLIILALSSNTFTHEENTDTK